MRLLQPPLPKATEAPAFTVDPARCPYYHLVPKDPAANLKFRRAMVQLGYESREAAEELWIMCSRDILFWFNTFVWTYDPAPARNKTGKMRDVEGHPALPFITWEFQDKAILEIERALGRNDLAIKKSRDMGASWMCLMVMLWRWMFRDLQSFMALSRTEDAVDKSNDPDSLFWKVDFALEHFPKWLCPRYDRTHLHFGNIENGSTFDGGSTASDAGRGGRRTGILHDEFASVPDGHGMLAATRDATPCRLLNSTPKGTGNAFYDMCHNETLCLELHWSVHPLKSLGLYYDADGKARSPWYDEQCKRAAHPMEIAQELDIDFLGSDFQFFDAIALQKAQSRDVRQPFMVGELSFDDASGMPFGFSPHPHGRLKLWINLDEFMMPPDDRDYAIAIDVSMGTGASNSAIAIGDRKTNEKVGEFVTPALDPSKLATYAAALARFFSHNGREAYVIWEDNGPGKMFRDRLMTLGIKNIYYRRNEDSITRKVTEVPGWWTTVTTKLSLLGEYRRALGAGEFVNRSYDALQECKQYIYGKDGSICHSRANVTIDPSGARDNHADRVIADALLWKVLREGVVKREPVEVKPVHSFWGRREGYRKLRKAKELVWA